MIPPTSEIENKKKIAIEDFNLLSQAGVAGFYNICELTHIFLINRKTSEVFNYYALLNFLMHSHFSFSKAVTLLAIPNT